MSHFIADNNTLKITIKTVNDFVHNNKRRFSPKNKNVEVTMSFKDRIKLFSGGSDFKHLTKRNTIRESTRPFYAVED